MFGALLEVAMPTKVQAVVARSTCQSQNVQSTLFSEHFWKLRCSKSVRGAKHISKSKCTKYTILGALLEVEMFKKCTWREAHFNVQSTKCSDHFWRFCQKCAKREGFAAFPKAMADLGHLKRIWKDASRVAGAVQETCSSELLGGPGADFLRGVAFWSIRSSVLGRWFCVTGAALRMTWHHFFVASAVL